MDIHEYSRQLRDIFDQLAEAIRQDKQEMEKLTAAVRKSAAGGFAGHEIRDPAVSIEAVTAARSKARPDTPEGEEVDITVVAVAHVSGHMKNWDTGEHVGHRSVRCTVNAHGKATWTHGRHADIRYADAEFSQVSEEKEERQRD